MNNHSPGSLTRKISFLLLFALFAAGCKDANTPRSQEPSIKVTAFVATPREIAQVFEFTGQTQGAVDAEVRARVEGVITAIHFLEGSSVKKGDLLYEIDPAPYQAKVAEARAKLLEAETRHQNAISEVSRYKPLAAINAVSKREFEQRVTQEGVARSSVEAAKAVVAAAEIQLGYTRLDAPVSGKIGLTRARIGEFVGRDPSPIVLNVISELDPIHVRFTLSETEYLKFSRLAAERRKQGGATAQDTELTLVLADGYVHPHKGRLISADNQINRQTGSFAAEASFPNPDENLRSGLFARVRADWGRLPNVLAIPRRALRQMQGRYELFIVKDDDTVAPISVKLGTPVGDQVVIEEGLTAGMRVVLEGVSLLRPGMKVEAEEVAQPT